MGRAHVIGHGGGAEPRRLSALAAAIGLDLVAVLVFVVFSTVVVARRDGGGRETFFSDPLPAVLVLAAATAAVAAGMVAAVSLARTPLRTRAGRWATRLATANALLLPVVGLSVEGVAWLAGANLPDGWGQPIVPAWIATGFAAAILGVVAKEPGRRGLLVVPLMLGAFVLTFWLGEILAPH